MELSETVISFLEDDCIEQFGNEQGNKIFQDTNTIYQELLQNADD